jgi:Fe-S-cluster containining protein
MDLAGKLTALDKLYTLYDQFTASLDLACKKYCSHCCTTSVTLTTIEGYKIIGALALNEKVEWDEKIQRAAAQKHFKPKITTNRLANLCADGIEPPQEEFSKSKSCPFLTAKQCPIYGVRPFGCRCLVSRHDCGKEGYADMDDFVLSVNTLFLQTIEHLDAAGCSGNLLDVLEVMASGKNRQAYEDHRLECAPAGLIANAPLKVLMIPPQHRTKMEPILNSLQNIRI